MPILPLGAVALTVILDGRPLHSYLPITLTHGHIVGPVEPYITRVADRIEHQGPYTIFTRSTHHISLLLVPSVALSEATVPLAIVLRALGERVTYDPARYVLEVTTPVALLQSPQPFNVHEPQAPPTTIFTPIPPVTPRPIWTGAPRPRRTPIPLIW